MKKFSQIVPGDKISICFKKGEVKTFVIERIYPESFQMYEFMLFDHSETKTISVPLEMLEESSFTEENGVRVFTGSK